MIECVQGSWWLKTANRAGSHRRVPASKLNTVTHDPTANPDDDGKVATRHPSLRNGRWCARFHTGLRPLSIGKGHLDPNPNLASKCTVTSPSNRV